MKLNVLEAAAKLVRAERPALGAQRTTNGLAVQETVAQETAERLATAGLGGVSVARVGGRGEYAALMAQPPRSARLARRPQRGLRLRARVRRGGPSRPSAPPSPRPRSTSPPRAR